jgi:cardiolipin synthase
MPSKRRKISQEYSKQNKVQLIRGGKEYFELILSLIGNATESIHLQVYIYEADETGKLVAAALQAAAKRNVKVYLLVDGYASQQLSKTFIADLQNAGVQFRFFEPLLKSSHYYFGRRMHHKLLVVDSRFAVTGSKNISDRYNDMHDAKAWLDLSLFIEGAVVKDLCVLCSKTWNGFRVTRKRVIHCEGGYVFDLSEKEATDIRIRRNDWLHGKNQVSLSYTEMFRNARSYITILCSYFLPGNKIRKLLERAAKRGVVVKVIVAGKSDVRISKNAERWLYDWLLRNHIEVYEYEPAVLHAKTAVCDSAWVTLGSYNINNLSAYTSIELNVDIRNTSFAEEVEQTLQDIIQHETIRITTETHLKTKNILTQFIRWASYQSLRLLLYLVTFYYKRNSLH